MRVASIPFISGMLMSIKTNAGLSSCSSDTASVPFAASPTSSNSEVRFSTALIAARKGAWSSTMRTGSRSPTSSIVARRSGVRPWWCHVLR